MFLPLVDAIQQRVAIIAKGPSTARKQGAVGVITVARQFLSSLPLKRFATDDAPSFRSEEAYQQVASELSAKKDIVRVHLDTYLWVEERDERLHS